MTDIIHEIEAAVVGVKIVEDKRRSTKRYLRTTIKCYLLDPVNNPVVAAIPYNVNRYKTIITTNDAGVIVTSDNPGSTSQVDTAASPPGGAALHIATMGVGYSGATIYGPDALWLQAITGAAVTRVNVIQHIWCYHD